MLLEWQVMHIRKKSNCSFKTIILLEVLLCSACLIIFRRFLFRDDLLVYEGAGSDTRQQYIMWYTLIANRIRSGNFSLWDFYNGTGGSMFNYYLFHPMLVIIYALGACFGPAKIPGMMVYLVICEILLSGLVFYLLLSQWHFREDAKLIISFLYSLNGYFVVWGQHYALGFACIELPLLLLVIEKSLRELKNNFFTALVCALIILSGYYQGYMIMMFMPLYVTVRVLFFQPAGCEVPSGDKERKRRGLKLISMWAASGFAMGFGVLMGGINLLPSAGSLAITSRLETSGTFLQRLAANISLYGADYYKTLLYRLFSCNLQGVGRYFGGNGNYYEAVNITTGFLSILLLGQFFPAFRHAFRDRRRRIGALAGTLICAFMLLVKAGSWMFNGFAYAFSRHTFLLIPVICIACCFVLSDILETHSLSLPALLLGTLLCVLVYGKAWMDNSYQPYKRNALILLIVSFCGSLLLWAWAKKRIPWKPFLLMLLACTGIGTVSDTFLSYNGRETVSKSRQVYENAYNGDTAAALAWIRSQDDQFYRVEKDYTEASGFLDSMLQSYAGITTYNSQQNANIQKYVTVMEPRLLTGYDRNHYSFRNLVHDPVTADLLGVKYILSRDDTPLGDDFELVHKEGDVCIFRNLRSENIGSFFTSSITQKQYQKKREKLSPWSVKSGAAVVPDKLSLQRSGKEIRDLFAKPLDGALLQKMPSDEKGTAVLTVQADLTDSDRYAYADLTLRAEGRLAYRIDLGDGRPVTFFGTGKDRFRIYIPRTVKQIRISTEGGGEFSVDEAQLRTFTLSGKADAEVIVDQPERGDKVSGTVRSEEDGILMLAIPYQEGWKANVDGAEIEMFPVDYGFCGMQLAAGTHSFQLVYEAPLFRQGVFLTVITAAIWVLLFMLLYVRGKRLK